jgi:hypothetical protein
MLVEGFPSVRVDQLTNPFIALDAVMMPAIGADELIGEEIFGVGENAAIGAFRPESVGDLPFLLLLNVRFRFLSIGEPVK